MEAQALEVFSELKKHEFSEVVSAGLFAGAVQALDPRGKAELLALLQEESCGRREEMEKVISCRVHLCLAKSWEVVCACHRRRGTLEAQLYGAQLPQVGVEIESLSF